MKLSQICELVGRNVVEAWFSNYELSNYLTPSQIEQINKMNVWNKERLASKIVDHYFMREIGQETIGLFKHYAKVKMQEIMERYLPAIYSNSLEYDPLESVNFDITETREIDGNASGNSNSNSENEASGMNINNDTPQTNIEKQDLDDGIYASSVAQSDTQSKIKDETFTNSNTRTFETFKHHEFGNKGVLDSYQKMIMQYRETIYAVDEKIIKEVNPLFMGLF